METKPIIYNQNLKRKQNPNKNKTKLKNKHNFSLNPTHTDVLGLSQAVCHSNLIFKNADISYSLVLNNLIL